MKKEIKKHLLKETDDGFWKSLLYLTKSDKKLKKKFLDNLRSENEKMYPIFLKECIEKKLFTKDYYEKELKGKYIDDGCNSLTDLMRFWLSQLPKKSKSGETVKHLFVTMNKLVLNDKKKLEKLFGVKIISAEKAVAIMKKENKVHKEKEENMRKTLGLGYINEKNAW